MFWSAGFGFRILRRAAGDRVSAAPASRTDLDSSGTHKHGQINAFL